MLIASNKREVVVILRGGGVVVVLVLVVGGERHLSSLDLDIVIICSRRFDIGETR